MKTILLTNVPSIPHSPNQNPGAKSDNMKHAVIEAVAIILNACISVAIGSHQMKTILLTNVPGIPDSLEQI